MSRKIIRKTNARRWTKSLCLSTIAWIMMSVGLVAGFVAEEGINKLDLKSAASSENSDFQALRSIESTLGIMLVPGESAIKSLAAIWIMGWFMVFSLDQLVLKPMRNRETPKVS